MEIQTSLLFFLLITRKQINSLTIRGKNTNLTRVLNVRVWKMFYWQIPNATPNMSRQPRRYAAVTEQYNAKNTSDYAGVANDTTDDIGIGDKNNSTLIGDLVETSDNKDVIITDKIYDTGIDYKNDGVKTGDKHNSTEIYGENDAIEIGHKNYGTEIATKNDDKRNGASLGTSNNFDVLTSDTDPKSYHDQTILKLLLKDAKKNKRIRGNILKKPENTPLSDAVREIIEFIKDNPYTTQYFYEEMKRIEKQKVIKNDLRQMVDLLEEPSNIFLKDRVRKCFMGHFAELNKPKVFKYEGNKVVIRAIDDY